jgi:hypothetical protein
MIKYIHTADYIEICLSQCPFNDCIGVDHPTCPVQQQAQRDRAANPTEPPIDRSRWLTLKEVAQALDIPKPEVEREFYKLRQAGVSIPGTWRRGGIWYYRRTWLNYYRRIIAPPDYGDCPPLGEANSYDDPAWLQARPKITKGPENGKMSVL